MELISTTTVGAGGAANIEFSVPATYDDLLIVFSLRSDGSGSSFNTAIRFNGDTGNNYSYRRLLGEGSGSGISDGNTVGLPFAGRHNGATSTASTFGTTSLYIPNYRSSTAKSFSVDSANENNATAAIQLIIAGLWTGTAAIDTIRLTDASGNSFVQHSSASLYGIRKFNTSAQPKATGGAISFSNGYWYHTFSSSGTFTPASSLACEYIIVAGGGGSAGYVSGGSGAGGLKSGSATMSATGHTVTIGAGGSGGNENVLGNQGSSSSFNSVTSTGGGRGGGASVPAGGNGGSGGGGGYSSGAAGSGTSGEGNNGGTGVVSGTYASGGGGGAGGAGSNSNSPSGIGGAGGAGLQVSTLWTGVTAIGDGGFLASGGSGAGPSNPGAVSAGGGGRGGSFTGGLNGLNGMAGTGGGGGGAGDVGTTMRGGSGGSGVVIIRYAA
jgi:hypothetical protein